VFDLAQLEDTAAPQLRTESNYLMPQTDCFWYKSSYVIHRCPSAASRSRGLSNDVAVGTGAALAAMTKPSLRDTVIFVVIFFTNDRGDVRRSFFGMR